MYVEIGAYKDTGDRALRFGPHAYGYTAQTCMDACGPMYPYFALQNNGWCSCDDDLDHATKYGKADCGKMGGGWCNYLYEALPQVPEFGGEFTEEETTWLNETETIEEIWDFVEGDVERPCEFIGMEGAFWLYKCWFHNAANNKYEVMPYKSELELDKLGHVKLDSGLEFDENGDLLSTDEPQTITYTEIMNQLKSEI
jgi:hypothetical protein